MPKLNPEELERYRNLLLQLRAKCTGGIAGLANTALGENGSESVSKMPTHPADLGTDTFEQEFSLTLLQNRGDTLKLIDAALQRIQDGTYGICETCGTRIPKPRLQAIPYASKCVQCASKAK
ncbi:MAG: TraR/DksA C4-type zinc finger protein [Thermoguttaceae bacterium]|nr:TraR/DksA C4-type zinc finger protein [Thermoguttaceae bacterium]